MMQKWGIWGENGKECFNILFVIELQCIQKGSLAYNDVHLGMNVLILKPDLFEKSVQVSRW